MIQPKQKNQNNLDAKNFSDSVKFGERFAKNEPVADVLMLRPAKS